MIVNVDLDVKSNLNSACNGMCKLKALLTKCTYQRIVKKNNEILFYCRAQEFSACLNLFSVGK